MENRKFGTSVKSGTGNFDMIIGMRKPFKVGDIREISSSDFSIIDFKRTAMLKNQP